LTFGAAEYGGGALFGTDSFAVAKKVDFLIFHVLGIESPERIDENAEGYKFLVPEGVLSELALKASGGFIMDEEEKKLPECCKKAYIRGAFLASGSASNPEKSYRAEIFSENESASKKVLDCLLSFGVEAAISRRKNFFVVYANKSGSESDMLKAAEASGAALRVVEARVVKNRRSAVNRRVNCEMANSDRTIDSSCGQRAAIAHLMQTGNLDILNPKLKEAAKLRVDNPDSSIADLAKMAGISKSAMFNRLKKLSDMAEESENNGAG